MKKRLLRKLANKKRIKLAEKIRGLWPVKEPQIVVKEMVPIEKPSKAVIIYRSELDFVSRCILDRPNIETGGQLFGFWTNKGIPVVLFAIGPGPKANHQVTFFNQDVQYLVSVGNILVRKYGLQHIGEWHSHHQLGLAHPSGHDASTMVNNIKRSNLGRFLLSIGNCTATESTFNAFTFTQSTGYDYEHAAWDIKEIDSPFRAMISRDLELQAIIRNPTTQRAQHGMLLTTVAHDVFVAPTYAQDYWLKTKENNLVLKAIMDFLSARSLGGRCAAQLDDLGQAHLSLVDQGEQVRVVFVAGFPDTPPLVTFNGAERNDRMSWDFKGDILSTFQDYYTRLKGGAK